ncbi:hypothetical protein SAMN05421640_3291 [Ekhidna lutea]|uniref:Uncharacterized protein n=1 Tax=Ekhidna lutea TaxID=447679 RepID=A0A239LJY1_EKHLU|nr:hypothetical protein [Ekhidna lutea]SNT30113.1 hypothetical protein SAMN05421640_3291 [Ekhidna lutea]
MRSLKIHLTFLFLLSYYFLFCQDGASEKLGFIQRSVTEVDSAVLIENIRQFLSHEIDGNSPIWFDGSIVLKSGYKIDGLKVKFNPFDNSVYINENVAWYKVSNNAIAGFNIKKEQREMVFRKGYSLPFQGLIEVTTALRHQDIISYLKDYSDYNKLVFNSLTIEKRGLNHKLSIELETKSRQTIFKFRNYLIAHDNIANVDSDYNIPELNENTYVEILFETESFVIVKHHFKKVAQIGSVSLSQHKGVFMFDEKDYYMAGNKNILTEFLFNKVSLKKAFYNSEVNDFPQIRNVGSERKLMNWLSQNYN